MPVITNKDFNITPEFRQELIKIIDERLNETLLSDLIKAQKRTEKRLDRLEKVVEDLAKAQKRSENRLDRLEKVVEDLVKAQKRSENRLDRLEKVVEDLVKAQKRTEKRVEELAEAQRKTEEEVKKLAIGLNETRSELGGLSRSVSYGFENEAFRMLPSFLKENYGIEIKKRLIRAEIGGKELNIFGIGQKDGKEVLIVGESKLRLDERRKRDGKDIFDELEEKVEAVKSEYKDKEIIKLLITHFAKKKVIEEAKKRGIIIIQSFEW